MAKTADTPKTSKWAKELAKLKGVVTAEERARNVHDTVLRIGSPSVDFTFGKAWGLPLGYTQVVFGPPKGGKSLYSYAMMAQLHRDYEDGEVVKFDTEFRDTAQLSDDQAAKYGIDMSRYTAIQTNNAGEVFDQIEQKLAAMCQDGFPLKLVIIDSINGIMGRRMENADSIEKMQIGDQALTLQEGFKRILRIQRKHRFAVLLTAQVRAQMDQAEIKRGNHLKMASSFGVQHYAEYFTFIERMVTVDGRKDMFENEFIDKSKQDIAGGAERTAHRIRVTMKDSSLGPAGRKGIMTFNYNRGLINAHHDLFELAQARGVIGTTGSWYSFGDRKYQKAGFVDAIDKDSDFAQAIRKALMADERNELKAASLTGINTKGAVYGGEKGEDVVEDEPETLESGLTSART